jgi:hypothetical protein
MYTPLISATPRARDCVKARLELIQIDPSSDLLTLMEEKLTVQHQMIYCYSSRLHSMLLGPFKLWLDAPLTVSSSGQRSELQLSTLARQNSINPRAL